MSECGDVTETLNLKSTQRPPSALAAASAAAKAKAPAAAQTSCKYPCGLGFWGGGGGGGGCKIACPEPLRAYAFLHSVPGLGFLVHASWIIRRPYATKLRFTLAGANLLQ